MRSRVSLHVLGTCRTVSCNQGAYALILAEDHGPRRIPVIIGAAEAQVDCNNREGIRTPRP